MAFALGASEAYKMALTDNLTNNHNTTTITDVTTAAANLLRFFK